MGIDRADVGSYITSTLSPLIVLILPPLFFLFIREYTPPHLDSIYWQSGHFDPIRSASLLNDTYHPTFIFTRLIYHLIKPNSPSRQRLIESDNSLLPLARLHLLPHLPSAMTAYRSPSSQPTSNDLHPTDLHPTVLHPNGLHPNGLSAYGPTFQRSTGL